MQLKHRIWTSAAITILLTAVVATAIYLWNWNDIGSDIKATAPLTPSCDLQHRACQAQFPDGSQVTLSISPRPILGLKPLQIRVQTKGIEAQTVKVDFRGLDMNMGYNRPHLSKESAGQYSGMGVLSACILERMTWEATVLVRTAEGVMAAPFRFETTNP